MYYCIVYRNKPYGQHYANLELAATALARLSYHLRGLHIGKIGDINP